jgi:hypothetical protein
LNYAPLDPFFRQLFKRLAEEIDKRAAILISGSALSFSDKGTVDATSTAMSYQKAVSYIEALQSVLELGKEIDQEKYGKRTNDKTGED